MMRGTTVFCPECGSGVLNGACAKLKGRPPHGCKNGVAGMALFGYAVEVNEWKKVTFSRYRTPSGLWLWTLNVKRKTA